MNQNTKFKCGNAFIVRKFNFCMKKSTFNELMVVNLSENGLIGIQKKF